MLAGTGYQSPPPNTLYYACRVYPAIRGIVINDAWSDLQPDGPGTPIVTGTIDAALAVVAAYNKSAAYPVAVRLRVWGNIYAPQWAKNIGGPIDICDPFGGITPGPSPTPMPTWYATPSPTPCPSQTAGPSSPPLSDVRTLGAFWSSPYQQAWANMQQQLAAKYDANPVIREVSVTSCASLDDEEFLYPIDAWSLDRLIQAGFTPSRLKRCLRNALAGYGGWHRTIVDDIINPFYEVGAGQPFTPDLAFTKTMARDCLAKLASSCMLDNQELGKYGATPAPKSPAANLFAMWQFMADLRAQGALVTFQTAAPPHLYTAGADSNIAGWNTAVGLAVKYQAEALELWPPKDTLATQPCTTSDLQWVSGYTCFSQATLLGWDRLIR